MTPREKAVKLIKRFSATTESFEKSKSKAANFVSEILDEATGTDYKWWQEVQEQIIKLQSL